MGPIPTHAADDYEALRDQLFGIERPGVRATGYGVLVRCGLAAWTQCHHEIPVPLRFEVGALAAAPTDDDGTRASLARLIAHLILTPKEMPSCQM